MTGLEEAFYIIGIIYMSLSLLIIFGVLIAVLKIRSKIVSLERNVMDKINLITTVGTKAGEVIETVRSMSKSKAKTK